MNRIGVALAADSAVSLGASADKIYTSADKLFHLSNRAPVGIMINGNANFLGVPWETIIKSFRSHLSDRRLDALEDYAELFFKYIRSNRLIFPAELQDRHAMMLAEALLDYVRSDLKKKLDSEAEIRDGLSAKEISPIFDQIVSERLAAVRTNKRVAGFGNKASSRLRARYSKGIAEIRKRLFGSLPLKSTTSRGLTNIVLEMLQREYLGPFQAGVVFAGFGEKDYMPKLVSYSVEEMVTNRPRIIRRELHAISDQNSAAIIPFAQQEMVHSFLRGIDPGMSQFVQESTGALFAGVIEKLSAAVATSNTEIAESMQATKSEIDKVLAELYKAWETKSREYWLPVVQIASALPKDELVSMAEALVNLTKFRRRISADRETVGGPIDVAVITKGDGFVWVKRKHYFSADLNPRAIAKYARDGG
jgi:hypothetical protein